jgi:hypothetical protein
MRAAGLLIVLLTAVPTAHAATAATPPCSQVSSTTFVIDGLVDQALADCVSAELKDTTKQLIVTSGGGRIELAMPIAERLAPLRLLVTVRGHCDSACQMYVLPVARRVEFEPGAYMLAHGGPDPAYQNAFAADRSARVRSIRAEHPEFTPAEAEAYFDAAIENGRRQAEMHDAFRRRYHVGKGWYLYREGGDGDFGRYLQGNAGPRPNLFGYQYLAVEEPMLQSCLPDVEFGPYQPNFDANVVGNTKRWRGFQQHGTRRSAALRCVDPATVPARSSGT